MATSGMGGGTKTLAPSTRLQMNGKCSARWSSWLRRMSWEKAQKMTELLFGLIRIFCLLFKFVLSIYVSHEINHKNLEKLNQSIKKAFATFYQSSIDTSSYSFTFIIFHFHTIRAPEMFSKLQFFEAVKNPLQKIKASLKQAISKQEV